MAQRNGHVVYHFGSQRYFYPFYGIKQYNSEVPVKIVEGNDIFEIAALPEDVFP